MAIASHSLSTPEWTFPTITNNHQARITGRKRGHDAEHECSENPQETNTRGANKKAKTADPLSSASNTSNSVCLDRRSAPHEFLAGAGDWMFEPACSDNAQEIQLNFEDSPPAAEPVDVEKVIAILLQALNAQSPEPEPAPTCARPHQRPPTSPLAPNRVAFQRKAVGGSCRGRIDTGLKRWVLSKNHYDDVRSYHPSRRSPDWVETLHEMGWENLHPTYMSQSQHTFKTLNAFSASNSCDDWIDADEGHSSDGPDDSEGGDELEGVHEDVWNLGTATHGPLQRRTPPVA